MTFKRVSIVALTLVLALGLTVQTADAKVSMGVDFAQQFDGTESDAPGASSSFGFSTGKVNIDIYGDVAPGVEAFVETEGPFASDGEVHLRQGYVTLSNLFQPVDVKLGQFEVNYGENVHRRSTNADVQDNPFIGNSLDDVVAVQPGAQFSGEAAPVQWSLGITNGTAGGNFSDGRGWALIPKVKGEFAPNFTAALSYYTVDHESSTFSGSRGDNLFAQGSPSVVYQAGPLSGLDSAAGTRFVGAANPSANSVSAYNLDLGYEAATGTKIKAWYGAFSVDNLSSMNAYDVTSYALEASHPFTPQSYGAIRYNVASNETSGVSGNTNSSRIQVALGHNLNENTQMKLEYVTQTNEANAPAGTDGTDASGIIAEGSVTF